MKVSLKDIILWVPGTSSHHVNTMFAASLSAFGDKATLVDYMASWDLEASIPDGVAKLTAALDVAARARKKGQRILVAGESQGALLISILLSKPRYRSIIDKAVLLGHPGISKDHFHDPNDKVLEINHKNDPATFDLSVSSSDVIDAVSKLIGKGDLSAIPFFLGLIFKMPMQAALASVVFLHKVPFLSWLAPDSHNYSGDMQAAVGWLLSKCPEK